MSTLKATQFKSKNGAHKSQLETLRSLGRMEQAGKAGEALAARAKAAGIGSAVFDRGGYRYHGRVKAFADGVREGGLTV